MFTRKSETQISAWSVIKNGAIIFASTIALSGCYVEVSHEHEAHIDKEVTPSNVTDYSTQFLVEAALIPYSLAAESPQMVIDPDAYTTPRARMLSRAVITETTYAYLFDDADCALGGYTKTEAEADTTSYSDGYTAVNLTMNAQAFDCEIYNRDTYHTVNSDIDYQVSGWYDDWEHKISSVDTNVSGSVNIEFNGKYISHTFMSIDTDALSHNDFSMSGTSSVLLDDGYYIKQAQLSTRSDVHYYLGSGQPHAGTVRIKNANHWVDLKFEANGVWRTSSNGQDRYRTWRELGF